MSACGTLFRRLGDGALAQCALPAGHICREGGEPSAHAEFLNGHRPPGLGDDPLPVRCHPTLCAQEPGHVGSHDSVDLPRDWRTPGAELAAPRSYRDLADALSDGPDGFGGSDFP